MCDIITIDKNKSIKIEKPNLCPNCQERIDPVVLKNVLDNIDNQIVVYAAFKCPICQQVFFAKYFIGISDLILMGTYDFSIQLVKDYCVKTYDDEIYNILKKIVPVYGRLF